MVDGLKLYDGDRLLLLEDDADMNDHITKADHHLTKRVCPNIGWLHDITTLLMPHSTITPQRWRPMLQIDNVNGNHWIVSIDKCSDINGHPFKSSR